MRPNIRVEIQNNLVEKMDVDENEEGEISDHEEVGTLQKQTVEFRANEETQITKSTFLTGVNILDKREQDKLQARAKRFSLNPEELKNFKDEDLQLLYGSLGITSMNESNIRFEVIHMRGIEQMNAADILDYFLEFAPVSVEWIDEESCNVVWSDRMSAVRALHFMSKPVRGMPVRDDTCYFDNNLQESEETDKSILLVNKNREVELQEDVDDDPFNKLLTESNSVDISEITTTIPPGYWRLGNKHPKTNCLLLRFSQKTDKKYYKIENLGRYMKSQGKKNSKSTVSQTGTQITHGIFGRNKDMTSLTNKENPWSVLAEKWDEDAQFREKERIIESEEPALNVKNHSLRTRLGSKRKEVDIEEPEKEPTPKKKVKIPRMKMYADEEEEKIKRKKMLKRIDSQLKRIDNDSSANSDLRTILNMTSRTHAVKIEKPEPEVFDLGTKLKNRNKKMVFEIKREKEEQEKYRRLHHSKPYMDREISRDSRRRRHYSNSDDESSYRRGDKPQSKVAVVIKTQKRPTVASAVASTAWSRVNSRSNDSESESASSDSESSESSNSTETEIEEVEVDRKLNRPGFTKSASASMTYSAYKNPLKIEISNDHYKKN